MVIHIKHNQGHVNTTTKVIERIIEKDNNNNSQALLQTAKEMAKVMAKEMAREMAKEMAKEIIANLPAQQIVQIRQEGSAGIKNDLIAMDESIADVTKDSEFKKNFKSLGSIKTTGDSGADKRDKLKALLKK